MPHDRVEPDNLDPRPEMTRESRRSNWGRLPLRCCELINNAQNRLMALFPDDALVIGPQSRICSAAMWNLPCPQFLGTPKVDNWSETTLSEKRPATAAGCFLTVQPHAAHGAREHGVAGQRRSKHVWSFQGHPLFSLPLSGCLRSAGAWGRPVGPLTSWKMLTSTLLKTHLTDGRDPKS